MELCCAVPYAFLSHLNENFEVSVAYDDENEKYNCIKKRNEDKLVKDKKYLKASVTAFNEFMSVHGDKLGYDLRGLIK